MWGLVGGGVGHQVLGLAEEERKRNGRNPRSRLRLKDGELLSMTISLTGRGFLNTLPPPPPPLQTLPQKLQEKMVTSS